MRVIIWSVTFVIHVSLSSAAPFWCVGCTKEGTADIYKNDKLLSGACGYGTRATSLIKDGSVGVAHSSIYNRGAVCGACFQVRCFQRPCKPEGTTIIVTGESKDATTAFVLNRQAFRNMISTTKGVVPRLPFQVAYRRVKCDYGQKKMEIRVRRASRKKIGYLNILLLFQGGQTDIVSIELAPPKSKMWVTMNHRDSGAVWAAERVPSGPLKFKFTVKANFPWINNTYTTNVAMPGNWASGTVFYPEIQITDLLLEQCPVWKMCTGDIWKQLK